MANYILSPDDNGIFFINSCSEGSCETTMIAKTTTTFKNVSLCALSGYEYDSGGVVVAAASPTGMYVATIDNTAESSLPQLLQISHNNKDFHAGMRTNLFGDIGTISNGGIPSGVEVVSVAVSAGWTDNGGGLAIAASTVDHVYYTTSYDDQVPSSSEILDLNWRDEWSTSTGDGWSGGAVDYPPPKYGLGFELRRVGQSPLLWVGGDYGLQALDLDLQIFRRFNGANQKVPYENITVVAPSREFQQGSFQTSLWVGTTMGLTLREGSTLGGASHWRYLNGPRYLPGLDGTILQVVVLKGDVGCGGCSEDCSVPNTPSVAALTTEGLATGQSIHIYCDVDPPAMCHDPQTYTLL